MTVKLYVLPSSTSSRRAKAFLIDNKVEYVEQNMFQEPLTWEQLFEILKYTENGVEDILSTRSKDYAALSKQGVDFEKVTLTELCRIVEANPKLLKSPIMVAKGMTLVGYNEEDITMFADRNIKKKAYLATLDMIRLEEDKTIGKIRTSKHDRVVAW